MGDESSIWNDDNELYENENCHSDFSPSRQAVCNAFFLTINQLSISYRFQKKVQFYWYIYISLSESSSYKVIPQYFWFQIQNVLTQTTKERNLSIAQSGSSRRFDIEMRMKGWQEQTYFKGMIMFRKTTLGIKCIY